MTTSSRRGKQPAQGQTKKSRRLMMIAASILLALSPFAVVEILVRSIATTPKAIDFDPIAGMDQLRPLFEINEVGDRYEIPPWRLDFFCHDSFPIVKPSGTRRIFVLGGSTVQGRPYAIETAFSTWLRLRLETAETDTDKTYEVINCGGVSYASYRVAKILDEVLKYQPDAIVMYTGHNEFLEDRSYSHVRELGAARRAITRVASYWATVGWLQSQWMTSTGALPRSLATEVDTRLDHVGGLESYVSDPAWRGEVQRQFAESLAHMVWACNQVGVPIIVCTPSSDIVNTPPFKIDVAHDGAAYTDGRIAWENGDVDLAKRLLVRARDQDVCPLRATSPIVESVRRICDQFEVPLIDTDSLLDTRDPSGAKVSDGIADPEFFSDHVHPTIAGHQRIAEAIAGQFERLGWLRFDELAIQRYESAVVEHLDTLDEGYYARGRQRLRGLKRWAAGRAAVPMADDENSLE